VSPAVVEHLRRAAEIEPAVSWTANGYGMVPQWHPYVDGYARVLVDLVAQLRPFPRAIVAVPWVGIGGADLVSLNYARALAASPRFKGDVTMLATYTPSNTLQHLVPEGVRFVQVSQEIRSLTPNQQRRIIAQALLMVAPELVVSVNCFDVTNSLHLYGHQLADTMRIHLTLFAFDRIGAGYPVNPITDDGQREYLDEIEGIITDNTVTAAIVSEMLALGPAKVRVHHQPALETLPPLNTTTRAHDDRVFTQQDPFRLVWPHRLDKEKRPDSLIRIAELLRKQDLPVSISVHGQQVLSSDGAALMKSLAAAGVIYRGPYSGGLEALPTHEYHALLLTSESEGLPLVLVQSMLLGLPVIATAVGGVTDIVRDNVTGLLVSSPDDAEGFVRAITQLMGSVEERQKIIRTAYDFAAAQHGWEHFTALVDALA
jgi:glycosyltransferase involved in cell wall biosynthesis